MNVIVDRMLSGALSARTSGAAGKAAVLQLQKVLRPSTEQTYLVCLANSREHQRRVSCLEGGAVMQFSP
jgi:hypothetical protein